MSLRLYYHPLSSYCWKALIALYEADAHFEPVMINLGDPEERARLAALWPVTKFPVLEETASGQVWPEASILIERLAQIAPAARGLVPVDPDAALKVRLCDRIFDLHVQDHMQRIVADRLRPADAKDPTGVAAARAAVAVTYDMLERDVPESGWFCGEASASFIQSLVALNTSSADASLRSRNTISPVGSSARKNGPRDWLSA